MANSELDDDEQFELEFDTWKKNREHLMSKFETGEPMRYVVPTKQFVAGADIEAGQAVSIDERGKDVPTGFDTRHCWAVFGAKPDGSPFMLRWVPGSFGMKTLEDCEREARKDERNINSFGGSVRAVKQHLDINDLWQDS